MKEHRSIGAAIGSAMERNARRAAESPDPRPYVPPVPVTPAERVQGEAGEVAE